MNGAIQGIVAELKRAFVLSSDNITYDMVREATDHLVSLRDEGLPTTVAHVMLWVLQNPLDGRAEYLIDEIAYRLDVESFEGRCHRDTGEKLYGTDRSIARAWLNAAGSMSMPQKKSFLSFLRWAHEQRQTSSDDAEGVQSAIDWWVQAIENEP